MLAIGLVAGTLTICSFLAQSYKILKTRDVKSLSAPMWMLTTAAFGVWVGYGAMLGQWPIVVPNAVCFVLAAFILVLKLLPAGQRRRVAEKLVT
jgi:MtN3 and saliva related transmembrane protein